MTLILIFYPVNLQHSSCNHVLSIRVENSVGPGQMAAFFSEWIDLGLAGQSLTSFHAANNSIKPV